MVRPGLAPLLACATLALPGATTLRVFSPWAGSLPARGATIATTVRGSCTSGSKVLRRPDAWRCSAAGTVYDPCFASSRAEVGAHVLCLSSPWEDATSIELTRALPRDRANPDGDPRRFRPWAVVTAAGERCELAPEPLGTIAGLPVTYACAGSALLLGLPSRGRTWTQARAAGPKATRYERVVLKSAWW